MDLQTVRLLADYNKKTNHKMNNFLTALTADQWNRKFGGYFDSVRSMCNHIYVCDFNWLKRFSLLRAFGFIKGTEIDKGMPFGKMMIGDPKDYIDKRDFLDDKILQFAGEITAGDLERNLEYTNSRGDTYNKNFGGLLLHMFNHQTHHRGMISLYLEEMNIENDYSNLSDIL